jgi:hypothetical protein
MRADVRTQHNRRGAAEVKRITPIEFRDAFANVVCERATELHDQWRNNAAYTAFVRANVLQPIAARLGLRAWCLRDYFHLDAVFYEERDEEHFAPHETWAKAISVAIEHENVSGPGTYREMNKLQLFNAPLKVLITYTSDDQQALVLLGEYSKIIRDADTFGDTATQRRQLVVFGDLPSEGRRWTFHAYGPDGFSTLAEFQL